ncbi:c-type cytochrome [Devosia sediminis]|uniref:C-type cytochrome n=1 Tax=Devosia sediminis TaxID=2798801 RepID=A0A934IXU0_9HYPH|nr:cytochrome c [Devosia sediminis]MBJ3784708.1 c-type cytochrome [Devosia sediminis]
MKRMTLMAVLAALWAGPTQACDQALQAKADEIFQARCSSCHNDRARISGLSLAEGGAALIGQASTQVSGMERIAPGDPENSYVFRKIMGTHADVGGSGSRMPIGPALGDTQLADIEQWIRSCQ